MNEINVFTIFLVLTCVTSIFAFNNPEWIYKGSYSPYRIARDKEYYRFVSHSLLHADWMHLLINMFVLWSFSGYISYMYKTFLGDTYWLYLLGLYVGGHIAGVLPSYKKQLANPSYNSIGASAGVTSVLFAYVLFAPFNQILLYFIPVPALLYAVLYSVYSYFMSKKQYDNTNHEAHLYGGIWGIVYTSVIIHDAPLNFINQVKFHLGAF